MLTPKKNTFILESQNFKYSTPIKHQTSSSFSKLSPDTNENTPNPQKLSSFNLLGLKGPWQVSSQKKSPLSSKQQVTDRFIPARRLFSEQKQSLHSIQLEEMEIECQELQNIIPFNEQVDQSQKIKDYNRHLSSLYCQYDKNQETVQSFSNKNFLKYSNSLTPYSQSIFLNQKSNKYFPVSRSDISQEKIQKIQKIPFRILDAPNLEDDYYLNLLEWSQYTNMISVGLGNKVYLWDAAKQSVNKIAQANDRDSINSIVSSVSWAKNSPHLAVGSSNGNIDIYDVEKGLKIKQICYHTQRVSALSWNNQYVISSGSRDKDICHTDIRENNQFYFQKSLAHKQEVCGLKWSPDGQKLSSGGNDNKLYVWDLANLSTPLLKYSDHTAAVKALAWSPHQHGLLASGGGTADKTIRLRNVLTGQTQKIIETGSQVCNLVFSKKYNQFVSTHGYSMNQIAIWKYPKIRKIFSLKNNHSCRVLYLAMSPDGETVVTGAGDETLRFWRFFPYQKQQEQKEQEHLLQSKYISIR